MTTCRICLQDGASCPIFDGDNGKSVHVKLSQCFKEKIEDIEGYPRNICSQCDNVLNNVCDFILKFKESQKILDSGLLLLKNEQSINIDSDIEPDNHFSEVDIEIKPCKEESDSFLEKLAPYEDSDDYIELLPLSALKVKKENAHKSKKVGLKRNNKTRNKHFSTTNKIASSILEGEFCWTGEQWCLNSTQIKIPKENRIKAKRRDTRLKLPKKKGDQPKLCDLCGDVFKTQYKLSTHRRNIHFQKLVKCPHCPKMSPSKYNLNRHIKRKHMENTKREFICTACGHGFAFKTELSTHCRKVHSSNYTKKTFSCKYCDKTYKCTKSVLIHERSVHTGERPAECTICNKGFFHVEYLKEHMRLHTGEAPFKCPICDRGYAQRGNMKSHLRIHRISELDSVTLKKLKPSYLKLLKV